MIMRRALRLRFRRGNCQKRYRPIDKPRKCFRNHAVGRLEALEHPALDLIGQYALQPALNGVADEIDEIDEEAAVQRQGQGSHAHVQS